MRQINNHSWEEAGFCKSQEETGSIELSGTMHETGQDRHCSPGDHDSGNPFPRAPAFDDDSSWNLEQNVSQVEHAYAETVYAIAEAQVGAHSEIREGNVDAIDEVHDVDQEHERKQAARNSPSRSHANFRQVRNQCHSLRLSRLSVRQLLLADCAANLGDKCVANRDTL